MGFDRATCRMLDEEHRATLALLAELERGLAAVPPGGAPGPSFATLARTITRALAGEVDKHFRFEEDELFPLLAETGEGDIGVLLTEEHVIIRATAAAALPHLEAAAAGKLDAAGFAALRPVAAAFVEQLAAHIDKETLGLLPMLEQALDEDADLELALAYAA